MGSGWLRGRQMARFETRGDKLFIDNMEVKVGYESFTGWYWFGVEVDHVQDSVINGKVYPGDRIWYGFVQGFEDEWGYFSETELKLNAPKVWRIPSRNLTWSGRR